MPSLTPYQKAALGSDYHISLTANAGSGKTFVLARRYVDIAVHKVTSLRNIVAITFTEQAASELNKKIALEINRRIEAELDYSQVHRLKRIRDQLVSANISTIHSFCTNILKEFSPEAGIDANFIPIESETSAEILELVIEEVFKEFFADDKKAKLLKSLIRIFGSRKLLVAQVTKSVYKVGRFNEVYNKFYENPDGLPDRLESVFRQHFDELLNSKMIELVRNIKALNEEVLSSDPTNKYGVEANYYLNSINTPEIENTLILLNKIKPIVLTGKGTIRAQNYVKKVKDNDLSIVCNSIEDGFDELRFFDITENYNESYTLLASFGLQFAELVKMIAERYADHKTKNALVDFDDLLLLAKKVLALDEVKTYLAETYNYIMIDEYQDTNEIQYDIFMPILEELKRNNLFVVGDEKQSIYRFRDAELKVFNQTRTDIKNVQGDSGILNLPHSFRVAPPIAQFVNVIFTKIFENPNLVFNEVEYKELVCARKPEDKGSIEFLINTGDEESTPEAEMVAREIINLYKGKKKGEVEFSDFAVLCRRRKDFLELEEIFERENIPFSILGGKGFYQKQVVLDVYNYLSFLLNRNNDAALVGILRSPFFMLDDPAIYRISKSDGYTFFQKLVTYSEKEAEVQEVVALLKEHIRLADRSENVVLLRKILTDTQYWSMVASRKQNSQEIANLNKLVNIARNYSSDGFKTLYDFVEFLNRSINQQEDEGQAEVGNNNDTVKIMTIHQSKGLEYKIIFLYGSNDKVYDDRIKSKSVELDKDFGILTPLPENEDYFGDYSSSPLIGLYNYINDKKNIAEYKRLLYVAITRAIDHLYICGTLSGENPNKNSFLRFIHDALNFEFDDTIIELNRNLKFMKDEEENFAVVEIPVENNIPVRLDVEKQFSLEEVTDDANKAFKVLTETINDEQQNEIISATKIATFLQCPVKYQLTYETGYSGLSEMLDIVESKLPASLKRGTDEEEELRNRKDLIGRVVHRVLEENPGDMFLQQRMCELMNEDEEYRRLSEDVKNKFSDEISEVVKAFTDTKLFREISSYKNFKNEYEVYHKVDDFYLYGIIDKLVITKDRILVIDYKTDSMTEAKVREKTALYLPQLKFYAYILNRMYPKKTVSVQLVFVRNPELSKTISLNNDEISQFGETISDIVKKVREQNFVKNTSHCIKCHYAINGKCPLIREEN